jgi:hypothetical protein
VIPILNSADPLCKAENIQTTVAKARLRQKDFLSHLMFFQLQGAIEDIDAQIYPGGPTLEQNICGLCDPITEECNFIGMDQTGLTNYILTYHEDSSRVAQETAHRLGIIMWLKFGEDGTVGFSATYIRKQMEAFQHNPITNQWESPDDCLQAESKKQMATLSYWNKSEVLDNLDDEDDEHPCIISSIIMNPPGFFCTSTTVRMSDSITASTMAGLKADIVKRSTDDSFLADPSVDLASEPWPVPSNYSSIWEVPGIPAQLPITNQFLTGINGA